MKPLDNIRLLTIATNLPGPVAVARLHQLGAFVTKIEPPQGDALQHARPDWYRALHQGQEVVRLNLKDPADRATLGARLAQADLLVTATRPAALERLGLSWAELHAHYPRLCQVAIVGFPAPYDGLPGHDLTYQARVGLLTPPQLPRSCIADLGGAQEVVQAALGLILARERGQGGQCVQVSLAQAAEFFAETLRHGLTAAGGSLGGGLPGYNVYRTLDGWMAVAALEGHFWQKLGRALGVASPTYDELQAIFVTRPAAEWEAWGVEHDLPIAAVRDAPPS
jgi:crotonobetainyl-CoA:carnitine CoA-transferase CaiB-like acyl-CoA transferase